MYGKCKQNIALSETRDRRRPNELGEKIASDEVILESCVDLVKKLDLKYGNSEIDLDSIF